MLEYLSLLSAAAEPERQPWERRTMLSVLDGRKREGYLSQQEASDLDLVSQKVERLIGTNGEERG